MARVISALAALLLMFMTSKAFEMENIVPTNKVAAQIGKQLVLECRTTGCSADPTFLWRTQLDAPLGGKVVSQGGSSTLTMEYVSFENDQNYLCIAFCGTVRRQRRVKVDVYSFPSDPVIEISSPLVLGKNVEVTCSVPDVYPSDQLVLSLKKEKEIIAMQEFYQDAAVSKSKETKKLTISFTPTEEDMGKEIACIAELSIVDMDFEPKLRHHTQILNIAYGPRNTRIVASADTTLLEEDALTLSCMTESDPPAKVVWKKQLADNTLQDVAEGYSLSIPNVQSWDSGTYICEVTNEVTNNMESRSQSISVQVVSSTTPALSDQPERVTEMEDVTMKSTSYSTPLQDTDKKEGELENEASLAPKDTITISTALTRQPETVTEVADVTMKSTPYSTPHQEADSKKDQLENEASLAPKVTIITLFSALKNHTVTYAVDMSNDIRNDTEEITFIAKMGEPDHMILAILGLSSLATVAAPLVAILIYISRRVKINGSYSLVNSPALKV